MTTGKPISRWKVCFYFFHVAGGSTISLVPLGHCLENCELSECHPALHRTRVSLEGPGRVTRAGSHCPQVPRWNTLISTAQGKTGHPGPAQQEGALRMCQLFTPFWQSQTGLSPRAGVPQGHRIILTHHNVPGSFGFPVM